MRTYLSPVTAAEKPTVRAMGARWDAREGRWWIDDSWADRSRFARWLPKAEFIPVTAPPATCWFDGCEQ